jgi:PhzF family phenazine biosynthesis protein
MVDAFADEPFRGNPAAVCILDGPAPESWMASVAREMYLSETAFVHREGQDFRLRWFTPTKEVELCGHATLASAHALWQEGVLEPSHEARFHTRSGLLVCRRDAGSIRMEFPANPAQPAPAPPGLWTALGIPPCPVLRNRLDYLLVVTDAAALRAVKPDFAALLKLSDIHGFVLTAPSDNPAHDYLCRYFVPSYGVDEDPVTGSIQTMLGPYWAERLGKAEVRCWQASARGGGMRVRLEGSRVVLVGKAVTVLRGEIASPVAVVPQAR